MQGVRRAEAALGETACVIGLGLIGQLVVRLLVASGVQVVGFDAVAARCRAAEKAGALRLRRTDDGGRRPRSSRSCSHATGGLGADHVLLAAGRRLERPRRGRRAAGPRPGPGRRHRQDQARPAVERLLREGARRPLLPLLRAGSLRRPLRARRHRLPGRLRALDRAPQPRRASSTCSPSGPVDVASLVSGRLPDRGRARRLRPARRRVPRRASGSCSSYPTGADVGASPPDARPARTRPAAAARRRTRRAAGAASASSGPATTPRSMLLPHLAGDH